MSFLASLGWNDGTTQEVYTPAELIAKFSLDRVQKSPAKFDIERLTWLNGYLIRHLELPELLKRCQTFWPPEAKGANDAYLAKVLDILHERLKFLSELRLPELTSYYFEDPHLTPEILNSNAQFHEVLNILSDSIYWLSALKEFSAENIEDALAKVERSVTSQANTLYSKALPGEGLTRSMTRSSSKKQVFGTLRIAISGQTFSPPLGVLMSLIGKDRTLRRLHSAQDIASSNR
jgi:glutamyl-tRNA synthetase